jgi:hypothetical protein
MTLIHVIYNPMGSIIVKGMDFDFEITDTATGVVHKDDDSIVPKNSTVVVKRKPTVAGAGLLTKLASVHLRGPSTSTNRYLLKIPAY